MKYTKPSLTYKQQIEKFSSQGLQFYDESEFVGILSRISYTRFKEYSVPFIPKGHNNFKNHVKLENIRDLYIFDHSLRMTVFEAIKVIEVALRTQIIQAHSISYGPFGYLDYNNFRTSKANHTNLIHRIQREVDQKKKNNERLINNYFSEYTSETNAPIWLVAEVISFGTLSFFFKYLKHPEKQEVCDFFNISATYLGSWIHSINYVRNICAHHGRLWNINMAILPKKYILGNDNKYDPIIKEYLPESIVENKIFYLIIILGYLLDRINSPIANRYSKNINHLIKNFPVKNLIDVGIASGIHPYAFDLKPWKHKFSFKRLIYLR